MITITFNPTTPEQMAVLAAAMPAYIQAGPTPTEAEPEEAVPAQVEPPKAKRASPKKPVAVEEAPAPAEEAPEPITLEQLRAKMAAKSQAGKGPECKALLARFAAANLTAVPVEQYRELMAAVEAL
jgi:hypothetical protein